MVIRKLTVKSYEITGNSLTVRPTGENQTLIPLVLLIIIKVYTCIHIENVSFYAHCSPSPVSVINGFSHFLLLSLFFLDFLTTQKGKISPKI